MKLVRRNKNPFATILGKGPHNFKPKTPFAALKAYEEGILPLDYFVNMSTSLHPIDELTYDVDTIERILSREDLSLNDNLLLMRIFEELVKNNDPEIALYAAESINLIESRYNNKIESLKTDIEESQRPSMMITLSRLYFELAMLNMKNSSIHEFYLKEAFFWLRSISRVNNVHRKDIVLLTDVLIALGFLDYAKQVLDELAGDEKDSFFILLKAKVEFESGHYIEVKRHVIELKDYLDELNEEGANIYSYWMCGDEE